MTTATSALGILFVATCLALVHVDAQGFWTGCPENSPKVEIGKRTLLCFHVANTINYGEGAQYTRVSFQPVADQYSRFHIPNSYNDVVASASLEEESIFYEKNVSISAAVQDKFSFLRLYYDVTQSKVYPYLTAIVDVKEGVVTGITWDDACVFCGGGNCEEVTYNYEGVLQNQDKIGEPTRGCPLLEVEDCNAAVGDDKTKCDLTIYTVWTGTDANGIAFQSAAFRFSQFPAQELENRLTQNLPRLGRSDNTRILEAVNVPMDGHSA